MIGWVQADDDDLNLNLKKIEERATQTAPTGRQKRDLSSGQFWLLVIWFDQQQNEKGKRGRERGEKNYKIKEKGLLPDGSISVCSLIHSFYVMCVCEESSHRSFSADANLSWPLSDFHLPFILYIRVCVCLFLFIHFFVKFWSVSPGFDHHHRRTSTHGLRRRQTKYKCNNVTHNFYEVAHQLTSLPCMAYRRSLFFSSCTLFYRLTAGHFQMIKMFNSKRILHTYLSTNWMLFIVIKKAVSHRSCNPFFDASRFFSFLMTAFAHSLLQYFFSTITLGNYLYSPHANDFQLLM